MTPPPKKWAILLGVVTVSAILWRLAAGAHPVDDAFITFRYAANLLRGIGLVFNEGERVLGTSTPFTAALLAFLAWPVGAGGIPTVSLVMNALADAISIILVAAIGRRLQLRSWVVVGSCLLFAFSPAVVRYSIGGMETSLATMVVLAAAYSFLLGKEWLGATLAGIGYLIRPDVIAIAAANVWSTALTHRGLAWRTLLMTGVGVAAAAVAMQLSYGVPIPQSVLAKAGPIYRADIMANSVQVVYFFASATLASPLGLGARGLAIAPQTGLTIPLTLMFFAQVGAWTIGLRSTIRRDPRAWILALYPLTLLTVYLLAGMLGSLMAEWYLVPLLPFWILPLLVGFDTLLSRVVPTRAEIVPWAILAVLTAVLLAGFDLGRGVQDNPVLPLATWDERESLYRSVAREIATAGQEDVVVAAPEIGTLGFYCDCRILDTVGLVSPRSLEFYPLPPGKYAANNSIPSDLIFAESPDYIVSLEVFLRDTLFAEERFFREYEPVWAAATDAFGSKGMYVFRRLVPSSGETRPQGD